MLNLKDAILSSMALTAVVLSSMALVKNDQQPSYTVQTVKDNYVDNLNELDKRLSRVEELRKMESTPIIKPNHSISIAAVRLNDIEQRLLELEERDFTNTTTNATEIDFYREKTLLHKLPNPQSIAPQPGSSAISVAFLEADSLEVSQMEHLENVESLFDDESLSNTNFSRADCRLNYCRLEYTVNQGIDRSVLSLEENEMLLLLGNKYGENTTFHLTGSNQSERVLFIELGDS